jgi:hypothetical protein
MLPRPQRAVGMDRVFHLCDKSGDLVVVSTYVTAWMTK